MLAVLGIGSEKEGRLRDIVAAEMEGVVSGVRGADLAAFDLALYDVQPPSFGGADNELLFAPRLDNLASCHAAVSALAASAADLGVSRGIVLYDHEEVGSQSAAGASSLFLRSVLERLTESYANAGRDAGARALSRSLLVSADMAHAVHPNHAEKHDPDHAPRFGQGPVLKVNASQSYATDAPGAAAFERACRSAGFSAQRFVARGDMRCGSTIGPVSAARLSMRTVDVGNPMLSMHSCREVAASADVARMIAALSAVFSMDGVPKAAS
jgi:aspartyl aminopeptidase